MNGQHDGIRPRVSGVAGTGNQVPVVNSTDEDDLGQLNLFFSRKILDALRQCIVMLQAQDKDPSQLAFYRFHAFQNSIQFAPMLEDFGLTRIIHEASTAAADPGMSSALRSFGLLDVLSSTPAGPLVARLVSMPVCAASLRTFMNNAG
jgi:hypothetical protein